MPFIEGTRKPETAEQLMRSRYCAYASNHINYLYKTYAKASQLTNSLTDIQEWAEQTRWLTLEVVKHDDTQANYHYVEFIAKYLVNNEVWLMHEISRFIKEDNHWRYLDGDVKEHQHISTINRNEACPCLSGKKFKRCCMR